MTLLPSNRCLQLYRVWCPRTTGWETILSPGDVTCKTIDQLSDQSPVGLQGKSRTDMRHHRLDHIPGCICIKIECEKMRLQPYIHRPKWPLPLAPRLCQLSENAGIGAPDFSGWLEWIRHSEAIGFLGDHTRAIAFDQAVADHLITQSGG